jgi:hypothetical protein
MAAKKKPARVTRTKLTIEGGEYSALETYAIALNEYYKALKKAGFPEGVCLTLIMDKASYPDWILPKPINPDHVPLFDPYEDEDED